MIHKLTDEKKLALILANPTHTVAEAMRITIQYKWNNGGGLYPTEQNRYDAVLDEVHRMLDVLMPDHENKARKIYSLVPWPVAASETPRDFGPIPTFEKFMGLGCETCGGSGLTGFIMGVRCPDCAGEG